MKMNIKKLYKSRENKVLAGVMGGMGEYLDVDPVILRVVYIVISSFTAFVPGALSYLIMAFIIPNKPPVVHENALEVTK